MATVYWIVARLSELYGEAISGSSNIYTRINHELLIGTPEHARVFQVLHEFIPGCIVGRQIVALLESVFREL